MEKLKRQPADADLKQITLELGRKYSAQTRYSKGFGGVTVFDEVAVMNDINAICAGAMAAQQNNNPNAVEHRLSKLSDLKNKNVISDEKYENQRQKILNEI